MYYLVYQITNKINNKIYIGVHKTNNLDDGYIGSGTYIIRAIKKYGIENFSKTILFEAESSEEMFQKEAELVEIGEHSYNLIPGGRIGVTYVNENGLLIEKQYSKDYIDQQKISGKRGYNVSLRNLTEKYGDNLYEYYVENSKKANKILKEKHPNHINEMREKAKSEEAREKRKTTFKEMKHQQGINNSQFGTMWITNGSENKKIKKDDSIPDNWMKGRKIKI